MWSRKGIPTPATPFPQPIISYVLLLNVVLVIARCVCVLLWEGDRRRGIVCWQNICDDWQESKELPTEVCV